MVDKATIRMKTTVDYKGKIYGFGKQYEVEHAIAIAIGSSCEILEVINAKLPSNQEINDKLKERTTNFDNTNKKEVVKSKRSKRMKAPKNTMITGNDKQIENK